MEAENGEGVSMRIYFATWPQEDQNEVLSLAQGSYRLLSYHFLSDKSNSKYPSICGYLDHANLLRSTRDSQPT